MKMDHLLALRAQVLDRIQATDAVQGVLAGQPDAAVYARYLTNVWHYAQHSAVVIGLAGARAVSTHPELADYLLHHAREELGHERWALDDLTALGVDLDAIRASRPVNACAAMIGYEYYVAGHANPVGLFGWLYILEAMGDDLGAVVSERIRQGLELPDGVKFLAGHGVADEQHTVDLTHQIETHVHGADEDDVHHVAGVVSDLYVRMFEELGGG